MEQICHRFGVKVDAIFHVIFVPKSHSKWNLKEPDNDQASSKRF